MIHARFAFILALLLSSMASLAAPTTRPVIVDLTFSGEREAKPKPLLDGMIPGYWSPGNFSPGDGTRRWEDPAFADAFVRDAARLEMEGAGDPNAKRHEPARAIPKPWTSRLVIVDFENLQRDDVDGTVRRVVGAIHRRAPGWKLVPFAWQPGWPDAKHPGPFGEPGFTQEMFNAACRPPDQRTPEANRRLAWMRQRMREQVDIARQTGIVCVSGALCEPASADRDILAQENYAKLLREEFPTTSLALVTWGGYVFDSTNLASEEVVRKQVDMALANFDYVIVWGPWPDAKLTARLVMERLNRP